LKPANAEAKKLIETFADEVVYNDLGRPLKGDEILKRLAGMDGYIAGVDYIEADVVEKMPESIKVISRYGAGVDRVDIPACTKRGILVCNTPGANAVAVCELAFGLMLCTARNIPHLHIAVEKGEWPRSEGVEIPPFLPIRPDQSVLDLPAVRLHAR
jgi:phosphoglycerate dehydrogenase-like enzyme